MVLVFNGSAKPVTYTFNGVARTLPVKQGFGLSGAESDYVKGLKLAGVTVGGAAEAPAVSNTSSPVSGRGPASESNDASSSEQMAAEGRGEVLTGPAYESFPNTNPGTESATVSAARERERRLEQDRLDSEKAARSRRGSR